MEYLFWAWRAWFGQITIDDVPEMIRDTCSKIIEELTSQKAPKFLN